MFESALLGTLLAVLTVLPLAWKWQLGLARMASLTGLFGVLPSLAMGLWGSPDFAPRIAVIWVATLILVFGYLLYRFYRDPERVAPLRDDVIVSPADGEVVYVRESRNGTLPVATKQGQPYRLEELTKTPFDSRDAVVIGIAMNFLDVHVNRAPIAGRVSAQHHFPGLFGSLRRPEMIFWNERATTVIDGAGLQVAVVQIASRLVRQIVAFIRKGQEVSLGQRIGAIRFGSQVDLVLPARGDLQLAVKPGDRVVAGESIIATIERSGPGETGFPSP